ncbi:hypothetical protein Tco_0609469 [Tanacetum coccineum]
MLLQEAFEIGAVTFQDPESARRACVDPAPIIDGRRANCNLASLGSPRHALPFGGSLYDMFSLDKSLCLSVVEYVRSPTPFAGGMPSVRGPYFGGSGYQQLLPYSYQQGLAYPPYTYTTYGPEYVYPQVIFAATKLLIQNILLGIYNFYAGQQYLQIYGVPGTVNAQIYPYSQMGQTAPNYLGYTPVQSYTLPGQQIVQFNRPNVNGITTSIPTIQAPYSAGVAAAVTGQHFIVTAPPQFIQGGGFGQISGYLNCSRQEQQYLLLESGLDLCAGQVNVFCCLEVSTLFVATCHNLQDVRLVGWVNGSK